MYSRLRRENPFMSGKVAVRSLASWSITLAPQDAAADVPIEQDELAIDGKNGALLGGLDALSERNQPFSMLLG